MLVINPSGIIKDLFTIDNIERTYEEKISKKDIRGIDRIGRYQFEHIKHKQYEIIHRKCLNGTYKYSPFAERLRLRGREREPRVISIPTIRDRIVLSLLKDYLHTIFQECVNRKLPNTLIKGIKDYCESANFSDLCFYKVDIHSFYDTINHDRLMKIISGKITSTLDLNLIQKAIQTPTVPTGQSRLLTKECKNILGVPQGLAISNILANIYLYELDIKLENTCLKYIRYVDDIFLVVRKADKKTIMATVKNEIENINLKISKKKTIFVRSNANIDYLGYTLNLPTISIKQATVERYLRSLSALFSSYSRQSYQATQKSQKDLIRDIFISEVNEKITGAISENRRYGWIFYFLEMNDLSLLHMMESIILDKFCNRLNTNPSEQIIKQSIKKLSKAYYHAKYSPLSGYIHNYDTYDTIPKKIEFLVSIGIIKTGEESSYLPNDIEHIFNSTIRKRISNLESDIGEIS